MGKYSLATIRKNQLDTLNEHAPDLARLVTERGADVGEQFAAYVARKRVLVITEYRRKHGLPPLSDVEMADALENPAHGFR